MWVAGWKCGEPKGNMCAAAVLKSLATFFRQAGNKSFKSKRIILKKT